MSIQGTQFVNKISELIVETAAAAAGGLLASRWISSIEGPHAALICVSAVLISKIVSLATDKIFRQPESNRASQFFGTVIDITAGLAGPVLISHAAGFPMVSAILPLIGVILISQITIAIAKGILFDDKPSRQTA